MYRVSGQLFGYGSLFLIADSDEWLLPQSVRIPFMPSTSTPSTSVIIPTFNKYHRLKFTLRYLLSGPLPPDTEYVLVHDGNDDSASLLESWGHVPIRYIHNELPAGRAVARNTGVRHANGELLIFLDDDILVDRNFVQSHQRMHTDEHTVVHGRILTYRDCKFMLDPETGKLDERFVRSGIAKQGRRIREQMTHSTEMDPDAGFALLASRSREDFIERQILSITSADDQEICGPFRWIASTTGNLSMTRDAFDRAGGFHEPFGKLWGLEDLELGFRLSQLNDIRFVYAADCTGIHLAHARPDGTEQFLRALRLFVQRHPSEQKRIDMLRGILVDRNVRVADLTAGFGTP